MLNLMYDWQINQAAALLAPANFIFQGVWVHLHIIKPKFAMKVIYSEYHENII